MSSRLTPFFARIKERYPLTRAGSTKQTYHVVLDLLGSNLSFKVGDSLGIYADNDPSLVQRILQALKASPQTMIHHPRTHEAMTLESFLTKKANLSRVTPAFLKIFQVDSMDKTDVLDFLTSFSHPTFSLQEAVAAFAPLLPRFYSVASSLLVHPTEAHLTVSLSSYHHGDELRYGVASHFLCHLAEIGNTPIPCYVQSAAHFTIPSDDTIPLIMVGPGTGVAPFRGFLQERMARQATGKHWLFFGERHRAYDFFYEEYWSHLVSQDRLALDLAFSRDQNDKVYVQHKLYEKGAEIWSWIRQGAHFYLCGEADPMAKDVEATLLRIFQDFGNLSPLDAKQTFQQLRSQKRYLADIY